MSVNSILAAACGFATRQPIPHRVKLPTSDGFIEETLYFVDHPASEVRRLLKLTQRDSQDNDAQFICETLCNEDGTPALEMDGPHGAKSLKLKMSAALVNAAFEAMGLTSKEKDEAKKD